jgi:hypothetical protein
MRQPRVRANNPPASTVASASFCDRWSRLTTTVPLRRRQRSPHASLARSFAGIHRRPPYLLLLSASSSRSRTSNGRRRSSETCQQCAGPAWKMALRRVIRPVPLNTMLDCGAVSATARRDHYQCLACRCFEQLNLLKAVGILLTVLCGTITCSHLPSGPQLWSR